MVVKMSHNFFYCFHRKRIRDEKGGGGDQEKIKKEKKKSRSIEGRRAGEENFGINHTSYLSFFYIGKFFGE